jgi:protein SCO1
MKNAMITLCLLLFASTVYAGGQKDLQGLTLTTEKGAFVLELAVKGKELKNGANSLDLQLRDGAGHGLEGAEIKLTPWMPSMGHGVWEKPVVTERGGGNYHVENVIIIMSGSWDLKVEVSRGGVEDRAAFSFQVAEKGESSQKEIEKPRDGFQRRTAYYTVPNVTLLNQDGKKVNLRALIDSGKPVIINFIFSTCTTICPVMSASFSNLRNELGAGTGRVQLISITIDPENDRPERMKQYLSRFNSGAGWEFLTGSRDDVGRVLKALDAFIVDKMSHEPLYIFHTPNSDEWVRIKGLVRKADLMKELRRMENK